MILAVARSSLCKGEMPHKLCVDHKTLVISRTGRMWIGGSGLCMEGEQRKNQSQARRRARSPACLGLWFWYPSHNSQSRGGEIRQGSGGVTDTECWSQPGHSRYCDSQSRSCEQRPTETSTPSVQWWCEHVKSCLCYFKMGRTVSFKLSTRGFVSTLQQWKFLKSCIKPTLNNK